MRLERPSILSSPASSSSPQGFQVFQQFPLNPNALLNEKLSKAGFVLLRREKWHKAPHFPRLFSIRGPYVIPFPNVIKCVTTYLAVTLGTARSEITDATGRRENFLLIKTVFTVYSFPTPLLLSFCPRGKWLDVRSYRRTDPSFIPSSFSRLPSSFHPSIISSLSESVYFGVDRPLSHIFLLLKSHAQIEMMALLAVRRDSHMLL